MDANGDFTISWTSYGQDIAGGGPNNQGQNGIFARRFNATAQMRQLQRSADQIVRLGMSYAAADVFQVNTFTAGNQQRSHVAMDAAGDIVIAYESFQDGNADATSYGVYARRYAPTAAVNYMPAYFDQSQRRAAVQVRRHQRLVRTGRRNRQRIRGQRHRGRKSALSERDP